MRRLRSVALVVGLLAVAALPAQEVPALARQAFQQAAQLKQAKELPEAEVKLVRAIRLYPDYADAWWMIAWVRAERQREQEALRSFQMAASKMAPRDPRQAEARRQAQRLSDRIRERTQNIGASELVVTEPESPLWEGVLGLPLALVGGLAVVCLLAAGQALRRDARRGPKSPAARFAAVCGRAGVGDPRAVASLLRLADDPALRRVPTWDFAVTLAAVAAQSPPARQALAAALPTITGRARQAVAEALAAQAEQPDPALWVPLLDDADPALRRFALIALSRSPVPAAQPALARLAVTDDPAEAVPAAQGLARLRGDDVAAALVTVCREAQAPEAQAVVAEALASRRQLPVTLGPPLVELLNHRQCPVRTHLVRALGAVGEPARPSLLQLLLDRDPALRATAREVLRAGAGTRFQVDAAAVEPLLEKLTEAPRKATSEALDVLAWAGGATAAPVLAAALGAERGGRPDWTLRRTALGLLAALDVPVDATLAAAILALPEDLDEDGQTFRADVCRVARQRRAVEALPAVLTRAARAPEVDCLTATAKLLAAEPEAGEALATALGGDAATRRLALELLARHPRPAAADALLAELSRAETSQGDLPQLRHAAMALGRLREPRALDTVRELVARLPEAAGDDLDAVLALLGDRAATTRVEAMLVREGWEARRPAATYYRELPEVPPRATAVVREADAHEAAEMLWETGAEDLSRRLAALGDAVRPTLEAWLADENRRAVAEDALARLG